MNRIQTYIIEAQQVKLDQLQKELVSKKIIQEDEVGSEINNYPVPISMCASYIKELEPNLIRLNDIIEDKHEDEREGKNDNY